MKMRVPWAFLRRDFLVASSYKLHSVLQLLRVVVVVPLIYFMSKLVPDEKVVGLGDIGANYFAFLLIGLAFLDYFGVSLSSFNQALRDSQLMGTLEIMLLSPTSLAAMLIYSSLSVYLFATVRFVLYIGVGLLFGLNLSGANVPGGLLILLLSVLGFAGFGILTASVTVVAKRGLGLNAVMSLTSLLGGGVLYPVGSLPSWLQSISAFVPMTYASEGMRLALLKGTPTTELLPQILVLFAVGAVLVPLGLLSFRYAVRRTKVTGTLGQY